eukprot:1179352-Prorocentrum_minimum.AAC.1
MLSTLARLAPASDSMCSLPLRDWLPLRVVCALHPLCRQENSTRSSKTGREASPPHGRQLEPGLRCHAQSCDWLPVRVYAPYPRVIGRSRLRSTLTNVNT